MTLRSLPLLVAVAAVACGPTKNPAPVDGRERGLYPTPQRLAFVCVVPGCASTQTVRIALVGDRRVAIKRIILSAEAGADFTIEPSQPAPFVLPVQGDFTVDVHYAPKGSPNTKSVNLLVTYTDASAVESPDRIPPGELAVPLVRRLVGEPVLAATPGHLSYGAVLPGAEKSLPLHLANIGFGNVALDIVSVDAGHPDLKADIPPNMALAPDAGYDLPVTWSPQTPTYLNAELVVTPGNPDVDPVVVQVEGTSLTDPRIGLEPEGDVDFGFVPHKQQRTITRQLVNQGGTDLNIQNLGVSDAGGNLTAWLGDGGTTVLLAPLARVPLKIKLDGQTPTEIDAVVRVSSSDSTTPFLDVHVYGTVTEPKVQLAPATVDFGTVPQGWVMTKPVEIRNVGFGPLTLRNITLVAGSSSLFTVRNLPSLPSQLDRGQRVAIEVEFRAETVATFAGFLSVETDDPLTPFAELPLSATVGNCSDGCPITNGTPTCARGVCEVGTCNTGWYDTDKAASTGCECHEASPTDPGSFCADGVYVGNLKDTDHQQANFVGNLPTDSDLDVIKFHAEDGTSWFSEDFDVRIRLVSVDPSVKMCVYRYDTVSHLSDCYWTNETCPSDNTYRKTGSLGSEDGADFTIKIYRPAGSAATCSPYTLYMSNG